jgi:PH (Pleckstrin Homology) domain-containing protein
MNGVFHIVPATIKWGTTLALLFPLIILLVVVVAIMYSMVASSRNSTFEVSSQGLRLRGDFYGRMIPASHLRISDVARVDLDTGPYRPTSRTNGIAIPGYRAGWFRLRNGRKGLLYVTDPKNVVVVPTTDGYDVLLSVINADQFVERIRALPGAAPGA